MIPIPDLDFLVPERHARWRPIVAFGLARFLALLPRARRETLLARQMTLPADAGEAERLCRLALDCPTLHKLGQVIARDPRLAPEIRSALVALESMAPAGGAAEAHATIRRELREDARDVALGMGLLAEGSVAVVLPFNWREADGTPREGVFKVLKPAACDFLGEELALLPQLAGEIGEEIERLGLPPLDVAGILYGVAALLAGEIDPLGEQANLAQAAELYADSREVLVPRLAPFCTGRITAMDRVEGVPLTCAAPGEWPRLARAAARELIARPFFASGPGAGLFHADPHGGNLMAAADGRLALLDWSLAIQLERPARGAMAALLAGALGYDAAAVARAVAELAGRPGLDERLAGAVAGAMAELSHGRSVGMGWLLGLLDRMVLEAGLTLPRELVILRKALYTLTRLIRDLDPAVSADAVLAGQAAGWAATEWPARLAAPFHWDGYPTHLSNAALLGLWAGFPARATRFWLGTLAAGGR